MLWFARKALMLSIVPFTSQLKFIPMKIKFTITVLLLSFFSLGTFGQSQKKTENVILITFDGLRWQEVFNGADYRLLTQGKDSVKLKNMYWAATAEERRKLLLPFFWNVIAKQGQLYGNRTVGNKVNTTNKMWFSYPGYNEILAGFADDERVNSNDHVNNPNQTVLEFLHKRKEFQGKVAAFTSWDAFPWIINTTRSGIPVNSGYMKENNNPNEREKLMNELMFQLPNESGGTRPDAFTFHYGFEYLKKNKPRVLMLSFDETDHFSHGGDYEKYLASAKYTDEFISTLWNWVQSQPAYKDKTTLIIATDHGRGDTGPNDWRDHGSKMPKADQIWFSFMGPDVPALGEVKADQQLYQSQIAKTMSALLGVEYVSERKTGDIIPSVIKK